MGEKKKNNGGEQKKKEDKGNNNNVTVVLKTDLHCEGCATKVLKCIRLVEGVETASIGDGQKITVVGKVDPVKLREKLEEKTHKKVELISPQPKKDNGDNNNNNKENSKGKESNQKQEKTKESKDKNSKDDSKSDDKKSKGKGPPVTTAVLKVHLHCEGCIQKIHKIITKTKGYEDMKVDKQKDLVTVTGAMDMKAVAEVLKKHLKKDVEIVPPKKEEKKKENGGGGGDKEKGGGGDKKKGGGEAGDGGGEKMEGHKMQLQGGYPYPQPQPFFYGPGSAGDQFHYNPYPVGSFHAPQIFSDENPNACSVM